MAGSHFYEAWVTRLRIAWMGAKARGIFGGFAKVLGDLSYDYALQGTLEHLPATASLKSLGLISSERQLETALSEAAASLAAREPYASFIHRFDGTALRLLLGLHFAGLDGATVVQQNGRQFSLTLPLPAFGGVTWDPTPNLIVADAPALAAALSFNFGGDSYGLPFSPARYRAVPAGSPWFALDNNPDLTNRFAIIFPTWPFAALATALFNNSDSAVVTWPVPFGSTTYKVIFGPPTDEVVISADDTTRTTTGITLRASAPWTGIVWCIGFAAGINPFNTFSSESVGLLTQVINLCRPQKAYCSGVYTIATGGRTWDYFAPGTTWDGGAFPQWDTNTVSQIQGAF